MPNSFPVWRSRATRREALDRRQGFELPTTSIDALVLLGIESNSSVTGTASATLANSVGSATGTHTAPSVTGTASATLSASAPSAAGGHGVSGTANAALGASVGVATGTVRVQGAGAATLANSAKAATGAHGASGTANAALASSVGVATGTHIAPVVGVAAATLSASAGSATGTHTSGSVTGIANATLQPSLSRAWGFAMVPLYRRPADTTADALGTGARSVVVSNASGSDQRQGGVGSGLNTTQRGSGMETP